MQRELKYRTLACRLPPDDPMAGVETATRGLEDARRLDDKQAQARFVYCRARSREALGRPDQSLIDWETGLELAREAGDWRLVADGLIGRAHMRSLLGEHARALDDFITAQQLYTTTGNARLARDNVINLGTAYRRMGEYDKALAHLQLGYDQAVRRSDWNSQGVALLQQGYLFEALDQPAKAQDAYERLIELAIEHGTPSDTGFGRVGLGSALI
ncbi:tetratricopeptide repeat protein, partial [Lysobacter sp. D1-1-M9]|uniref:tetratricopeptide repeat protein n=1 Tax=Novilysobacter longmucuonensis TaxID=3098603 RepID=UPI002FC75DE3